MDLTALRGVLGILALLAIAFALSYKRSAINWRTVGFAFALQIFLGAFVLYIPFLYISYILGLGFSYIFFHIKWIFAIIQLVFFTFR